MDANELTQEEKIEQIEIILREMSRLDTLTLSYAIALIPEYLDDGESAVLSAAAMVLAKMVYRNGNSLDEIIDEYKKIIRKNVEKLYEDEV